MKKIQEGMNRNFRIEASMYCIEKQIQINVLDLNRSKESQLSNMEEKEVMIKAILEKIQVICANIVEDRMV